MQITGHVQCVYPERSGTYMGIDYRNLYVVVVSDECIPGTNMRDRFVVKFKTDMIPAAQQSGCLDGASSYVFTLIADAEERRRQDGSPYAVNKSFTCLDIKPLQV